MQLRDVVRSGNRPFCVRPRCSNPPRRVDAQARAGRCRLPSYLGYNTIPVGMYVVAHHRAPWRQAWTPTAALSPSLLSCTMDREEVEHAA